MARVVVIGLGFIGCTVVTALQKQKDIDLTVIDRVPYFENNIAAVRTLVQPEMLQQTTLPHQQWLLPSTKLVVGAVLEVTDDEVRVDVGGQRQNVPFDFLIIVSGSSYKAFKASAATLQQRKADVEAYADVVKRAESILIVGGGPVGVEVMGEILHLYPKKKVTLINRSDRVLEATPNPKSHRLFMSYLQPHPNAKVILQDSVEIKEEKEDFPKLNKTVYRTAKGESIEADFVITAAGIKPNSAFMIPRLADTLDARGFIKVNAHLQVENHPKLFCLGDVSNADNATKMAANGRNQLAVLLKNLPAAIAHKPLPASYEPQKGFLWPVITTFGPQHAIAVLPLCGGVTNGWGMFNGLKSGIMVKKPPNL